MTQLTIIESIIFITVATTIVVLAYLFGRWDGSRK